MYNTTAGDPNSAVYYYCSDNLGSVVTLVDASGNVVERYSYDPWGEPTIYNAGGTEIDESAVANPFMFTAREVDFLDDGNLKLQHNRWRVLSYPLARWMQNDPLGTVPGGYYNKYGPNGQYKDGVNIYCYTGNDSISKVDVLGSSELAAMVNTACTGDGWVSPANPSPWWEHYRNGGGKPIDIGDWGYLDNFKAAVADTISVLTSHIRLQARFVGDSVLVQRELDKSVSNLIDFMSRF